jgi:transposase
MLYHICIETTEGGLCVDWKKIKAEYIAGGTSYRKLVEKYGVPLSTLQRTAKKEDWQGLKQQAEAKSNTKLVNSICNQQAKTAIKINVIADKLLEKIAYTLDNIEVLDSQSIKHFTSALKDIKEIKGEKSALDLKEQTARIAKLEKEAMVEQESNDIKVTIASELEDFSK